ncbi:ISL3 family transposase [Lactobacillus sp. CBA3606]|uniref:ISL3 family transposase n=1 Tax=Lactobacillus sp. CBA3606 TaxID=2099789 RepID=UPI000CFDF743|nr:ISL3 family transposase [Lactobacillus sp. CBA3606]AVK63046.1 ISL3 family transposase [Lactobacillus sp. CBA3606]AVK63606.1 ISL3 family transposase [Lactobacillus sp. CBA3606]
MSKDTKFLLGIKDQNIKKVTIINNIQEKGPIEVQAVLDYRPKACPKCGVLNRKSIIRYGWRQVKVKLLRSSERDVLLHLKKRNFKCKVCNSYFLAATSLTQRNHTISNNVRIACLEKLSEPVTMTHIAHELNISSSTVVSMLKTYERDLLTHYDWLPSVICMDEIKSTKDANGSMSFVFMDGETHQFIDILESRTLASLEKYFNRYTKAARMGVKVIVTDMNYTYPELVSVFPEAIIVTDRFHIVKSAVVGFNQTRIRVMKQFAKSNIKYKALKRYWKLLLKPNEKLDIKNYRHYSFIAGRHTQNQIVEEMLEFDPDLKRAYDALHTLRSAVKYRDLPRLRQVLDASNQFPEEMEKHFLKLRDSQESIENALRYQYSNGPLEGTNNKIKVLKHTAYGFGNFNNFRLRIHLMFALKKGA